MGGGAFKMSIIVFLIYIFIGFVIACAGKLQGDSDNSDGWTITHLLGVFLFMWAFWPLVAVIIVIMFFCTLNETRIKRQY